MDYTKLWRAFATYCHFLVASKWRFLSALGMQVGIIICNIGFPVLLAGLIGVLTGAATETADNEHQFIAMLRLMAPEQYSLPVVVSAILLSMYLVDMLRNYLQISIQSVFDAQAGEVYKGVTSRAIEAHLRKPYLERIKQNPAQLQGLLTRSFYAAMGLQTGLVGRVIPTLIEAVLAFGVMLWLFGGEYVFLFLLLILAFVGYSVSFSKKTDESQGEYQKAFSESLAVLGDTIQHHEQIVAFGGVERSLDDTRVELEKLHSGLLNKIRRLKLFFAFQSLTIYTIAYAIIGYIAYEVLVRDLAVAALVLLTTYLFQFSAPLNTIGFFIRDGVRNLQVFAEIAERFGPIRVQGPHGKTHNRVALISTPGSLVLKDVSFSFPSVEKDGDQQAHKPLLYGINLVIEPGLHVALVGANGMGKSTLARIIGGQIKPETGTVKVAGVDLYRTPMFERSNLVRYVPQSGRLFAFSALENLVFPRRPESFDQERVKEIIQDIDERLVKRLGDDFASERQSETFSGGEAQKILLARTLLNPAPVLVLDEAASDMDHVSEDKLRDVIRKWCPTATVIFVTHNREFASRCDSILEIEDGLLRHDHSSSTILMSGSG